MKILIIIALLSIIGTSIWYVRAQRNKGTVTIAEFVSGSVKGNKAGEDPNRRLAIYLPPGYDKSKERYPVIYFLHGFGASEGVLRDLQMHDLLDEAIAAQRIKPVILVAPGSQTVYGGSFYTNSELTGNWADYIAKDVVEYVDKNYRTLAKKESRGLCGHSMGGNGAIKLAMLFPEVYGSVYSMSPSVLNWGEEFGFDNPGFKIIHQSKTLKDVQVDLYANILLDMARTYSPNIGKAPFDADLPVEFSGDSMSVRLDVATLWESNFPFVMVSKSGRHLRDLKGLKIDWGKNDEFRHIPVTCREFSKRLGFAKVNHETEEYEGGHGDKLTGANGRINQHLLPFFAKTLSF